MVQDIKLDGKTFSNVPYIMLPKASGGLAKFVDSSDATASAQAIIDGYTAYVDGEKVTGTASGTPTVLTTKSIIANGTYDAEDDNATGYSSVMVNVQPADRIRGTFEGTASGPLSVIVPYLGNGYPISAIIYPSEGSYNANGIFYPIIQKSLISTWMMIKNRFDLTPSYSTTVDGAGVEDKAGCILLYKSAESDPTKYDASRSMEVPVFLSTLSPSSSPTACVRFHSATQFEAYIAASSYGFMPGLEYTYEIRYSE